MDVIPFAPGEEVRLLELSPDGTMIAGLEPVAGRRLCTYAVPSGDQVACADLESAGIGIRQEDIVWSPDGRSLAFAENPFTTFSDGDLWIMDAAGGELRNLTDDGFTGSLFSDEPFAQPVYADVAPAWSPDGATIAFSRAIFEPGNPAGSSELWTVDVDTGEASRLAVISPSEIGVIYQGVRWSPDGSTIYASLNFPTVTGDESGLWAFDAGSGEPEQLMGPNPDAQMDIPVPISISPDGSLMTVYYPLFIVMEAGSPGGYGLLSLTDGSYAPLDRSDTFPETRIIATAFSPDGGSVVFGLRANDGESGFIVARDLATGEETLLFTLPPGESVTIPDYGQPLSIAENGLMFVGVDLTSGYLVTLPDRSQNDRSQRGERIVRV